MRLPSKHCVIITYIIIIIIAWGCHCPRDPHCHLPPQSRQPQWPGPMAAARPGGPAASLQCLEVSEGLEVPAELRGDRWDLPHMAYLRSAVSLPLYIPPPLNLALVPPSSEPGWWEE